MTRRRAAIAGLGFGLFLAAAPEPPKSAPAASLQLAQVVERVWVRMQENSLPLRRQLGLPLERLPRVSEAAAKEDAAFAAATLDDLAKIDRRTLGDTDLDTLGVLEELLGQDVALARHHGVLPSLTPYASPLAEVRRAFSTFGFSTAEDARRYERLLTDFPRLIDDLDRLARDQAAHGVRTARPELPAVRSDLESFTGDGGRALFVPAPERLAALNEAERARLRAAAEKIRLERIEPALASLRSTLGPEYENLAPAEVGLGRQPGGPEAYRALIRIRVGFDRTPEEIHAEGLAQMERIRGELEGLRQAFGFTGTLEEFRRSLRTDKKYFATRAEDLGERMEAAHQRILPLVAGAFSTQPKAPGGVERLASELEAAVTFGYYDPPRPGRGRGVYFYNGSKPHERSLLFAAALIYHELVPGHHFQIGLQLENEELSLLRRAYYSTAYTEGWGEYASDLAGEMGLYRDPWDRAGRLMMDAFTSARLVVDTGMNALGWTREQASQYLRDNTFQSDAEIATETLRYSCDIPAQALAYKLGALEIRRLRADAKARLGERFDLAGFHATVLGGGTVPLPVLQARVERWVVATSRRDAERDRSQK